MNVKRKAARIASTDERPTRRARQQKPPRVLQPKVVQWKFELVPGTSDRMKEERFVELINAVIDGRSTPK
jgi:hypothetical protein